MAGILMLLAHGLILHGGVLASLDAENVMVANELFGIAPDRFTVVPNGVPACPATGCPSLQGPKASPVEHVGTLN